MRVKELTRYPRCLLIAAACILTANGCHTRATKPAIDSSPPPSRNSLYIVKQGDTLAQISEHTTGDSANWQQLARHNHIEDPTKLRIGRVITVPIELLPEPNEDNAAEVALAPPADDVATVAPVVARATTHTPTQEELAKLIREPASVTISPPAAEQVIERTVETNDLPNDTAAPVSATVSQPVATQVANRDVPKPDIVAIKPPPRPAQTPRWIVLTGSYYPREIKNAPELGADTLALVKPGTRFQSLGLIGGWHKIMTDQGEGYVKSSDVRLE